MAFVTSAHAVFRNQSAQSGRLPVSPLSVCVRCALTSTSRRAFLVSAVGVAAAGLQQSVVATEDATKSFKSAQEARAALVELHEAVDMGEWNSLRVALRTGALGKVRASCTALTNKAPAGPQLDAARAAYRTLVTSVEILDTHALRASRGGDSSAMGADLDHAVESLDLFLRTVGASFTDVRERASGAK